VTTIEQTKDLYFFNDKINRLKLEAYKQRFSKHDDDTIENVYESKLKLRSHVRPFTNEISKMRQKLSKERKINDEK
jgi:hypothetical protein